MRASALSALIILAATGCDSPSPFAGVEVKTLAATYSVGTAVTFTATNRGGTELYLSRCCEGAAVSVDRWQGSDWVNYRSGMCVADCRMDAIDLPPAVGYVDSTVVSDTGRFRLNLGLATSPAGTINWLASNDFEVK